MAEPWSPSSPSSSTRRISSFHRATAPLTVGGLRQSIMTLMQTALGGGVLTLAYAMRLSGAVRLEIYDTSALLSRCIGPSGGPAMDFLLVLFGMGAMLAYFILLGDFVPAILDFASMSLWSAPLDVPLHVLRQRCMIGMVVIIGPLAVPKKLSGLRYVTPISMIAIASTASMIVSLCPSMSAARVGRPEFGQVQWGSVGGWGIFKSFSIFLFAFNCHLNVVPVAAEFQRASVERIGKVSFRVVLFLAMFYGAIGLGGYLSFAEGTAQNILQNYTTSFLTILCQTLFSLTLVVGIATYLNPTTKSLQSFVRAVKRESNGTTHEQSLLDGYKELGLSPHEGIQPSSEVERLVLICLILVVSLTAAILVPNVGDVMGFMGASVGTGLMMVLPTLVLLREPPPEFSPTRRMGTAAVLIAATVVVASGDEGCRPTRYQLCRCTLRCCSWRWSHSPCLWSLRRPL
mmetsp:Transcript_44746/g.143293  ORF Transcript_44746/g.143293 Transcript_44746/m.143293 type:complete len:459 (+) Transcript_44746:64-1440(+)